MVERFRLEQEAVLGRVHVVGSADEAREALRTVLDGARSYIRSPHALLDAVGLGEVAAALGLETAPPESADVGVTGCELAVAATGSVGLSSSWGRLAALLPPHHVVVLSADQLVWDINDAYALLARAELPGAWGMHTGPSRSADIEQTMALGVHGPGRVDVIVLLPDGNGSAEGAGG
jgi:L-lactate dehydrogenase complex protein LldG